MATERLTMPKAIEILRLVGELQLPKSRWSRCGDRDGQAPMGSFSLHQDIRISGCGEALVIVAGGGLQTRETFGSEELVLRGGAVPTWVAPRRPDRPLRRWWIHAAACSSNLGASGIASSPPGASRRRASTRVASTTKSSHRRASSSSSASRPMRRVRPPASVLPSSPTQINSLSRSSKKATPVRERTSFVTDSCGVVYLHGLSARTACAPGVCDASTVACEGRLP